MSADAVAERCQQLAEGAVEHPNPELLDAALARAGFSYRAHARMMEWSA